MWKMLPSVSVYFSLDVELQICTGPNFVHQLKPGI